MLESLLLAGSRLLALELSLDLGSISLTLIFSKQRLSTCLRIVTQTHTKVQIHVHVNNS